MLLLFALGQHPVWTRRLADGRLATYYYDDRVTWLVAFLALAWLTWFLVRRHRLALALRRPARRGRRDRALGRAVRAQRDLSSRYLPQGFSANIHAVGVGRLGGGYCVQVFVADAGAELWPGAGAAALPPAHLGVPVVLREMAAAVFLSDAGPGLNEAWGEYAGGIRVRQEVIVGGISGANVNLAGQSGTIGYFCTRRRRWPGRREVYLLSNTHVFADPQKEKADEGDLIVQPSPGEPSDNRPVGALADYSALKFEGDAGGPNHVDAAIAKLWPAHQYAPVIPHIGAVRRYVEKKDVELGEAVCKFGRTTGPTKGRLYSTNLDIRISYARTGRSALFHDQFLIEPATPTFTRFVAPGDSGSLLVDCETNAVGLIFAGAPEPAEPRPASTDSADAASDSAAADAPQRVEGYGVANPISEVLDRLKIDLVI
jgi:hypothetical protein